MALDPFRMQRALIRLENRGLIERNGDELKTTPRWQSAMARSAIRLYRCGDALDDLRVPIALALVDVFGSALDGDLLADFVEAMLPIEALALEGSFLQ